MNLESNLYIYLEWETLKSKSSSKFQKHILKKEDEDNLSFKKKERKHQRN